MQDGNTPTIENLRGTVAFERKVSVGYPDYENAVGYMSVQFDFAPGSDKQDIIARARQAFFEAKAVVFEQLGVEFEVGEGGVLIETIRKHFPTASVVQSSGGVTDASNTNQGASTGAPAVGDVSAEFPEGASHEALVAWATARFASHPSEFFDNRGKKASGEYKATAPDLKHKSTQKGVWFQARGGR